MQVTVRYFASIREAIGTGMEAVVTQATTVAGLRDELYADLDARLEAYLNANAAALGASPNATFTACAGERGPGGQAGRPSPGRQQQICPASSATSSAPATLAPATPAAWC